MHMPHGTVLEEPVVIVKPLGIRAGINKPVTPAVRLELVGVVAETIAHPHAAEEEGLLGLGLLVVLVSLRGLRARRSVVVLFALLIDIPAMGHASRKKTPPLEVEIHPQSSDYHADVLSILLCWHSVLNNYFPGTKIETGSPIHCFPEQRTKDDTWTFSPRVF